jgi:hypothetical protein
LKLPILIADRAMAGVVLSRIPTSISGLDSAPDKSKSSSSSIETALVVSVRSFAPSSPRFLALDVCTTLFSRTGVVAEAFPRPLSFSTCRAGFVTLSSGSLTSYKSSNGALGAFEAVEVMIASCGGLRARWMGAEGATFVRFGRGIIVEGKSSKCGSVIFPECYRISTYVSWWDNVENIDCERVALEFIDASTILVRSFVLASHRGEARPNLFPAMNSSTSNVLQLLQ